MPVLTFEATIRRNAEPALAFGACTALLVLYALRGGTFDVVPRAELGIAAWWTVALGWAAGVLPRARPGAGGLLPLAALLALAAWTAISLGWSTSDERTAGELARIVHHAGLLALAASLLGPRTWRPAVGGAVTGALIVCALALASRLWPATFPVDRVGTSFGPGRLSYPLNYWNAVGAWGAMSVAVTLAWSAHAATRAQRMLALAALPVAASATYLTYSRAGVAGVALGVLVAWAVARHRAVLAVHALLAGAGAALAIATIRAHPGLARAEDADGRGAVLLALAVAAALGAGTAWLTWRASGDSRWRVRPSVARRLVAAGAIAAIAGGALALPAASGALSTFREQRTLVDVADPAARLGSLGGTRIDVWKSALAAFREDPLHGVGAGTFESWWSREGRGTEFLVDAHSLYLEALAELGVPGLALVLALCAAGLLAGFKARRGAATGADAGAAAACIAGFTVWLFHAGVDWMWESTATVAFALLLVAAAGAARTRPAPNPLPRRAARARTPSMYASARCTVVVIAAVALLVQLPALVGTSSLRASQAAAAVHDERGAQAAANDAAATQPWAASPHVQLALLAERRGELTLAEREARLAVAREPANWRHPLLLARVLAGRGDAVGALEAYATAERLHPLGEVFRTASVPAG